MAGLACGEPCTIGWDILDREADAFISMTDNIAARGMRILANPVGEDRRVVSGESGAAAMGDTGGGGTLGNEKYREDRAGSIS